MRVDSRGRRHSRRWLQSRASRKVALRSLLLAVLLVALFGVPLVRYFIDFQHTPDRPLPPSRAGFQAIWDMALAVPAYYANLLTGGPNAPSISLDIEFRHLRKLAEKRQQAVRNRILVTSEDDLVPATLRTDRDTFRVKVRLKGDYLDHLRGDRWSFRVEVRDRRTVFGMNRFSLQAPYTRDFHREAMLFDFLRSHGVLAPRYFFVNLYVNGTLIGITALEEHFSRELLESQQRREGVILKYNESYYWQAKYKFGYRPADYSNWRNTPVAAFRMRRIGESEELSRQLESGVGLLRGVMRDRIAPARVFDAKLWGRLMAACEIWSGQHVVDFRNVRMYLNPLTFELEPIAFDATLTTVTFALKRIASDATSTPPNVARDQLLCQGGRNALADHLLTDPEIRDAFFSALGEMASSTQSADFVDEMQAREREYLDPLKVEFPWLRGIDWERMRARAAALLEVTEDNYVRRRAPRLKLPMPHSQDADYPAAVFAYLESDASGSHLQIDNALSVPVRVTELRFEPDSLELASPLQKLVSRPPPYRLGPSRWPEKPQTLRLDLDPPVRAEPGWSVRGIARVGSGDRDYPFRAQASFPASSESPVPRATLSEALAEHLFLELDPADAGWLRVKPGTWNVEGWLVLPQGFGLRVAAGTRLRFEPGAALVARGPLDFRGERDAPVVLEAQPQAARAGSWRGLVVLSSDRPSYWSHVVVRNTTGVARENWILTGGVTFRLAEVELSDSLFDGSQAEDALNLIRSEFELHRVEFRDAASDALDADFCRGRIDGGSVRRIGGDGIDVGGSQIEVDGVHFEGIRDKALSVGEGSRLRARHLRVESTGIGLASKDASDSFVADSSFENIERIALMAYVKKTMFGGSELVAEDVRIDSRGRVALAQLGSRIRLNGAEVPPEALDVAALYESRDLAEPPEVAR